MTTRFKTSDGKSISLFGYGAMRLPTVDGGHANGWALDGYSKESVDQKLLNEQVRRMLDGGLNYFDTSPVYCRGDSERCLGEALTRSGYDRDSYVIATKLSNFSPTQYSLAACQEMFARSLANLQTDYIDNYLLHSIGNFGFSTFESRYLKNGALDWCRKLRDERKIRNLGFSFHGDIKAWEWCLAHHGEIQWDFVQIQLNYVDWQHAKEINPRNENAKRLYDDLTKLKIPVVVMEPLLGGRLARYNWAIASELKPLAPEASLASWALRFCGSLENVMTVLSGMTLTEHIEENLATFSPLQPLGTAEFAALERAARALLNLDTVPCNSCQYCMPCPYGLDIPGLLTFGNQMRTRKQQLSPREILKAYKKAIPEPLRRADHCTDCGRCLSHCPQAIDIPAELARLDAWIETQKDRVSS